MNNPFNDFEEIKTLRKEIPLTKIHLARTKTINTIKENYSRIADEEARELVWLVEQSKVVSTYTKAYRALMNLEFYQDDIEEFLNSCFSGPAESFMLSGPAGLYISAMVNYCQDSFIALRVNAYGKPLHFLGYRLREGKKLLLNGNTGDFTGASLDGGELIIEGSVGNWCGAGMKKGLIEVMKSAGEKTGEWMKGGEIRVSGIIKGRSDYLYGGKILELGRTS